MDLFDIVISGKINKGGSSVEVTPLSVTENGEYTAPEGTAYSPVTVNVPTGGGGSGEPMRDVNFYDYDGTIVKSYSASQFASVSAMPENPSHDGLVAQGWNWSLSDAKAYVSEYGKLNVGQMYITESGDTEIDVEFTDSARLSPILMVAVNGTVTVDWGDNTTADTVTGASLTTRKEVPHTYSSAGRYHITIHVVSGEFQFYGSDNYPLLTKHTSASNENRVYANCVKAVRFGNGVTNIGNYAFQYCYSLASITIPYGVTSIGNYAFSVCISLASITIPNGATSIGSNAFYTCYSLASVTIPYGVTRINDSAFSDCRTLASITIPYGVTSIGNYAFYSCISLASITIPNGVTSIGTYVFSTCYSLASITIPSGVTNISSNAFANCSGVAEYHILPTTPPSVNSNAFSSIAVDCVMYVPSESLEAYKTANGWSTYASRMVGE